MTRFPIVQRELIVASRNPWTYRSRAWIALVGLGLLVFALLNFSRFGMPPSFVANQMFVMLGGLMVFTGLLGGAFLTADSLSSEKRQGTLGLLFLTDLRGHDIVLGKLAAGSLSMFYSLAGLVPLLGLPILVGGVSGDSFVRVAATAMVGLFVSVSVGVMASSLAPDERSAFFLSVLILILLLFAPLFFAGELGDAGLLEPSRVWWIKILSPGYCAVLGLAPTAQLAAEEVFWVGLLVQCALALVFLSVASAWIARYWRQMGQPVPVRHTSRVSKRTSAPGETGVRIGETLKARLERHFEVWRRKRILPMMEVNPSLWLELRLHHGSEKVWLLVLAVCAIWLATLLRFQNFMSDFAAMMTFAIPLHTFLRLWLAAVVCGRMSDDRGCGALELILSTPTSEKDVLRGYRSAFFRQFAGPTAFLFLVELLIFLSGWRRAGWRANEQAMMFMAGWGVFLLDYAALCWFGLRRAIVSNGMMRPLFTSIMAILLLPWSLQVMTQLILSVWVNTRGETVSIPEQTPLALWFGFSVVVDLGFGLIWARRSLNKRFRELLMGGGKSPVS